jgi:hypothetical protein
MALNRLEQMLVDQYTNINYPRMEPEPEPLAEGEMPFEPYQVAQAGPGVTGPGGAAFGVFPGAGRRKPENNSDIGQRMITGAPDFAAGAARGFTGAAVGLPGDVEKLGRFIYRLATDNQGGGVLDKFGRAAQSLEESSVLPSSEDLLKNGYTIPGTQITLPPLPAAVPPGTPGMGMTPDQREAAAGAGQFVGELVGDPVALAKGGKLAVQGGKALLKATENVPVGLSIKPVGNPEDALLMPVKVAGREIKIPADQAAVLQKAIKNLTPEEQAKFRSDTAQKFVTILSELPSTKEFAAAAIGGKAKKGWYEGSAQAILQVFGPDAPRFAALLSATSPQTSVESNLFNALQVWKNWTAAGRPTDRDAIVKVMGQSVQGSKGEESVLDAWINNSVRALSSEDPSKVVLSGPKVNSFMLNLQGNVDEVTNDAWMAAFSLVDQKIFGGSLTKGGDPGKGPGYLAMNARVRETASYLTKVTGETWTPAEVQETIWSWAKTLYETAGSAGENRSAVQLIRDNAITDQLIASTPDFRTLFYDARFQPILEQAGYADQLTRLREATGAADGAAGGKKPRAGGQAGALDPGATQRLNERNAKRLDALRKQREQASAEKAQVQNPSGGVE